jgi:hypothetical protein
LTTNGLLELHELAGRHRFAHATGHTRSCGGPGSCWRSWASSSGRAVASDWLANQFECISSGTAGCAWFPGSCRGPRTCRPPLALGHSCAGTHGSSNTSCTASDWFADEFRSWSRAWRGAGFGRCAHARWCPRTGRSPSTGHNLRLLALGRTWSAWGCSRTRSRSRWCLLRR